MRSIIKCARTVQFNWVPGLAIEDYGTVVEIVGDEKLRYDVGRPSMSELREKYLPIYNEITNN